MGQEFGKPSVVIPRPCIPHCFAAYPSKIVHKLFQRLKEISRCDTPDFAGYALNRNNFKNIFADVMLSGSDQQDVGTLFDLFDDDKNGLIDGLEVVTTMCLVSKMRDAEKIEFVFDCYDTGNEKQLGLMEAYAALEFMLTGSCKVFPVRPPSCDQCDEFSARLLATSNDTQTIPKQRFVNAVLGGGRLFLELVANRRNVAAEEAAAEEAKLRQEEAQREAERKKKSAQRAVEEAKEREIAEQEQAVRQAAEAKRREAEKVRQQALAERDRTVEEEERILRSEVEAKIRAELEESEAKQTKGQQQQSTRAATTIQARTRGKQQRTKAKSRQEQMLEEGRIADRIEEELEEKKKATKAKRDEELQKKRKATERKREETEMAKQRREEEEKAKEIEAEKAAEQAQLDAEEARRKEIAEERGVEVGGGMFGVEETAPADQAAPPADAPRTPSRPRDEDGDGDGQEHPILHAMASAMQSIDDRSVAMDLGSPRAEVVSGRVGVRVVEATVSSFGGLGIVLEALESSSSKNGTDGGSGRVPAVYVRSLKPTACGEPNALEAQHKLCAGAALLSVDDIDVSRYSVDAVSALLKPSAAPVSAASPKRSVLQSGTKKLVFQLVGGEGFEETRTSDILSPAKSSIRFDVTVPAGPIGLLLQEREDIGGNEGSGARVFIARVRKLMLQQLVPVGAAVVAVDGIDTSAGSLDWCSELVAHAADRPRRLTLEVSRGMLLPGGAAGAEKYGVKCPAKEEAMAQMVAGTGSARAHALRGSPASPIAPSPRVAIQNVENKEVVLKVPVTVGLGLVLEEQQQAPRIYIARFDELRVKGPDGSQVVKKNPLVGVIPVGAYLVQINDKPTTRLSLKEVTSIIQQSGNEGPRRVLKFRF
jgi:hypothetical protein